MAWSSLAPSSSPEAQAAEDPAYQDEWARLGLFEEPVPWDEPIDPSGRFAFSKTLTSDPNTCVWEFRSKNKDDIPISNYINSKMNQMATVIANNSEDFNAVYTMPVYVGDEFISVAYVKCHFEQKEAGLPKIEVHTDFFFGDRAEDMYPSVAPIPSSIARTIESETDMYEASGTAWDKFAEDHWERFGFRTEQELRAAITRSSPSMLLTDTGYCEVRDDIFVTTLTGDTVPRPVCALVFPSEEGEPGDEVDFGLWSYVLKIAAEDGSAWKTA